MLSLQLAQVSQLDLGMQHSIILSDDQDDVSSIEETEQEEDDVQVSINQLYYIQNQQIDIQQKQSDRAVRKEFSRHDMDS
eukprot:403338288